MNPLFSWKGSKGTTRGAWARRATIALPLLCLMIFGTIIGANLISKATGASAATLTPMKGHVPALVKTSALVGPTDANQSLALSIGLKLRNEANLKSYVDNMSRAQSTTKKHLTSAQIAAAFAPLASSQQSVIDYLQSYGFHVTLTMSQHLIVNVQGTVGDAENALHIQINNYHSPKGQDFYAPSSEPMVSANLAGLIQNIAGLDNVGHYSRTPLKAQPQNSTAPAVTANTSTCTAAGQNFYTPKQISTAYNLDGLHAAGFNGEGQAVALVEFDDYKASDISTFTQCYGQSHAPINRIKVDGGVSGPGAGAGEVELDMEMILGAAPNLASLNVYEAPNTFAHGVNMWAQIINNDAIPVISTSWGACENAVYYTDPKNPGAILWEENSLFAIAAAQGQTIVAAAGDLGTNDCGFDLNHPSPTNPAFAAVDDPASQPYVTGVGGTRLALNSDNSYNSESVWNNLSVNSSGVVTAGGGGISQLWYMPSWQQGPGVNNSFTSGAPCGAPSGTNCREVPDVSLNSDYMNSSYLIYCTVTASGGCSGWWGFGGTSAAAPLWAAFMALTNQKSLHDGGFNIGCVNPYLYQIDQNAGGTSYSNDFHDITVGNNDGLHDGKSVYPATPNYDMASGLGSYNAWNLANDLEKLANAKAGLRGAPAATTWYFAEGSVGGQFTEYLTLLNSNASQTAHVSVQYLFENQAPVTIPYTVAPSTRFTTTVNNDLGIAASAPQQAISAIVTSDVAIVAERPMYFNRPADLGSSGTDVLGATDATKTTFYFAAGDSSQTSTDTSNEYITVLNPSASQTANITATYYSGGISVGSKAIAVAPLHRGTIGVGDTFQGKAAIQVISDIGVVVERPIYAKVNVPTAGGVTAGAASTVAATAPSYDWLFAEGHTADNFQENLVIANFGTNATNGIIKLEYTNGTVQNVPVTFSGLSQLTFDVNNAFLHPLPNCYCTPTADVSVEVSSARQIVAERVMFFHYKGSVSGMTDVVGEPGPNTPSIYSFAEGYTNNSFEEWLTLQNPRSSSEVVAITLFFDGTIVQKEVTLPAYSRTTFNINSIVAPIAAAYPLNGGDGYNVSIDVQVFNGTIVVERPLYFNYLGQAQGGTDVIGYTG